MSPLPSSLMWGPIPPETHMRRLRLDLEKAFRDEGLPTALISGMVNRAAEIIEGWDWDGYTWHAHYDRMDA